MPKVVAIFDHMDSLTKAREALERAGFGDDVERIIDQSDTGDQAEPVAASPRAGGFMVDRAGGTAMTEPHDVLGGRELDLDLTDEEEDFVMQSVGDGARVMVIDTEEPGEVAGILEPVAQRIITGK